MSSCAVQILELNKVEMSTVDVAYCKTQNNSREKKQHLKQTASNRMLTARLPLDVWCVWGGGVGPQVNKFEQVTSDDPPYISSRGEGGVPRSDVWGGGRSPDMIVLIMMKRG